jgi:hypothetical protein
MSDGLEELPEGEVPTASARAGLPMLSQALRPTAESVVLPCDIRHRQLPAPGRVRHHREHQMMLS